MQKLKLSNIFGIAISVLFILSIITLLYMKYSNNCSLLGASVQRLVGAVVCSANNQTDNSNLLDQNGQVNPSEAPVDAPVDAPVEPTATATPEPSTELVIRVPSGREWPTEAPGSLPDQQAAAPSASDTDTMAVRMPSGREWPTEAAITSPESIPVTVTDPITDPNAAANPPTVAPIDPMNPTAAAVVQEPPPPPKYETPALLIADNKLKITSLVSAKVQSLAFKDGQEFKKDDILVTFDCKDMELDLDIQKEILKDREESLKNLNKLKELKSTSAYSLVKAASELAQTKKLIEKYENELKNCIIKADYSGKVIINRITEKEFLQAGQEIMTVNNSEQLLVKAYVPVVWLEWLKIGSSFELCFDKDNCYKGIVNRMGAEVDAISQTLDIFGKLTASDSKLIAGLSGQVTFDK